MGRGASHGNRVRFSPCTLYRKHLCLVVINASVQDGEGDAALVRVVSAQFRLPYGVSSYRKGSNQYIGSAWGKYTPDLWLTRYDYLWTIQE